MARDMQSIVKMSRREGYALHPKAFKALVKRTSPPGQQQRRGGRNKPSQYALQLREKQKVKRLYGLLERQFRNVMKIASRSRGQSGEVLLRLLEQRIDNAVYRSGFATSRRAARQLVTHGHFTLNGRRVNIPSIEVKIGDQLAVRTQSRETDYFRKIDDVSPNPSDIPIWMKVNRKKFEISITPNPKPQTPNPKPQTPFG